jgi:hypothetical protein
MIHGLPSVLTHVAFVYHDNMLLSEIIQGENLTVDHAKKTALEGA